MKYWNETVLSASSTAYPLLYTKLKTERPDMKIATLDVTGCQYLDELHKRIKDALDFPDYYGENLDAFWDCLNTDCDVDFVTIVGSSTVAKELQPTMQEILAMFEENKQDWADSDCPFDYEVVS